jgi:hypothetical protein
VIVVLFTVHFDGTSLLFYNIRNQTIIRRCFIYQGKEQKIRATDSATDTPQIRPQVRGNLTEPNSDRSQKVWKNKFTKSNALHLIKILTTPWKQFYSIAIPNSYPLHLPEDATYNIQMFNIYHLIEEFNSSLQPAATAIPKARLLFSKRYIARSTDFGRTQAQCLRVIEL